MLSEIISNFAPVNLVGLCFQHSKAISSQMGKGKLKKSFSSLFKMLPQIGDNIDRQGKLSLKSRFTG